MTKLSVAGAIRFAYGFTFQHIGAIIGLVWLPLVLVAILQFLPYAIGTAYLGSDPGKEGGAAALNLVFSTATFVLYAMNCVAVMGLALGRQQGAAATSLHFALGWPEWRMFAVIVMGGLMFAACVGIYVMIGTALYALTRAVPVLMVGVGIYAIAGLFAIAWLAVRFIFLLPPVAVVEERVDFFRAWILSRGNFWRILGVVVAVTVPLLLVQIAATAAIVGPEIFAPLPDSQNAISAALQGRVAILDRHMASLIGLALVLAPFSLGLTLGAACYGYRSFAGDKPGNRLTPQQ